MPRAHALAGTAEVIPAGNDEFDAVFVAQAWHWVDPVRAAPEIARVLRPHGRLGLIWNIRDEREDWVAQLGRLMHHGVDQDLGSDDPDVGEPFGPVERRDFEWTQRLTGEELLDLVSSRSYIIGLPQDQRAAVLEQVRSLMTSHPDLKNRTELALPYVTRCSRTDSDGAVGM